MQQNTKVGRAIFLLLATMLTVGLSGCGSDADEPLQLSGKLEFRAKTELPMTATARVSMFEQNEDGGDKRIVAERSLHELGKQPIAFELDVARKLIDPEGSYRLRAEIIDSDGNILLATHKSSDVNPLNPGGPILLRLKRTINEKNLTFKKYQCEDGFHLSAAHTPSQAVVRLGNRRLVLEILSDSASRKSFLDEHGNRLDITEQQLTFRVDNAEHVGCQMPAKQSADEQITGKDNTTNDQHTAAGDSAGED